MTPSPPDPPTRLDRRLGTADATLIGLGSMVGAGVFVAFGLAAKEAGGWLLVGLLVAAVVAACNAFSSAQLAALHPSSGGAYVYGRERLGPGWGFLAGWGFVFGKTASCAAMAMAIGSYLAPGRARFIALATVVLLTAVNYSGVQRTARTMMIVVPLVLAALALVVIGGIGSETFQAARLWESGSQGGVLGILRAGALIFFAFAGYARIATLGEEVRDPARTIPRAIVFAISIALLVYTAVAIAALGTLGPSRLALSLAPLTETVEAAGWPWATLIVRLAALVAAGGALLALLAGISRTMFAMAQNRDLPTWIGAVHQGRKSPYRAEVITGLSVVAILLVTDLVGAVGFSSFLVLWYYAVANLASLRLHPAERRWPPFVSAVGLIGCLVLGLSLSLATIGAGMAVLAIGWLARRLGAGRLGGV